MELNLLLNSVMQFIRPQNLGHGVSPDGKRDLNTVFGYGKDLTYQNYLSMYLRGGIAHTLVSAISKACWRKPPKLTTLDGTEILKTELATLVTKGFFRKMERADVLNRIGRYSVLLVGVPDGGNLDSPVSTGGSLSKVYHNPYSEVSATVLKWDSDPTSERFGKPLVYQIYTQSGAGTIHTVKVHWSRIAHLAEGALENDYFGVNALGPAWNLLIDKEKSVGAAAEAYYGNARQKYVLTTDKDTKLNLSAEAKEAMRTEAEAFTNNFSSYLRLQGMSADVVQPGMVSPRDIFTVIVEELAGIYRIPIRLLIGKGGGVLGGNEDKASWNSVIAERQNSVCTEFLLAALRPLVRAEMLDVPEDVKVEWPIQESLNETEHSDNTLKKARALNQVLTGIRGTGLDPEATLRSVGLDIPEKLTIKSVEENTDGTETSE